MTASTRATIRKLTLAHARHAGLSLCRSVMMKLRVSRSNQIDGYHGGFA